MNKRQAKKKRKKEQQRAMAEFYVAIEELPDIARKIGKALREVLDSINKALSEINVKEVCEHIKEQIKEQGEQDGAQN